jgi:hypothetical protein
VSVSVSGGREAAREPIPRSRADQRPASRSTRTDTLTLASHELEHEHGHAHAGPVIEVSGVVGPWRAGARRRAGEAGQHRAQAVAQGEDGADLFLWREVQNDDSLQGQPQPPTLHRVRNGSAPCDRGPAGSMPRRRRDRRRAGRGAADRPTWRSRGGAGGRWNRRAEAPRGRRETRRGGGDRRFRGCGSSRGSIDRPSRQLPHAGNNLDHFDHLHVGDRQARRDVADERRDQGGPRCLSDERLAAASPT